MAENGLDDLGITETTPTTLRGMEMAFPLEEICRESSKLCGNPQVKPAGKKRIGHRPSLWCDESVSRLFSLRYSETFAARFNTKNNCDKRAATILLASELSLDMKREFTAKQVQDKFAKLKSEWSLSRPTASLPTGNCDLRPKPAHYDLMMEYWGEKLGYQRESLMATDDMNEASADGQGDDTLDEYSEATDCDEIKNNDKKRPAKKAKRKNSQSKALESGFNAVKEGLMYLGNSMSAQTTPLSRQESNQGATLDDVLGAIREQSNTLNQLVAHLIQQHKTTNE
ncbi:hypothetical protein LEN26_004935 [Aphanomyces euteiches]|nr:hypothetical protein LEN26_004935 [Aphanomyces euteiches]